MREILFRGKRVDNGEWVYGSSFRLNENLNPFIMLINGGGTSYEVNNDTRNLFTGLTDKNGAKIFEGDICEVCLGIDTFYTGVIYYDERVAAFGIDYNNGKCNLLLDILRAKGIDTWINVIGNIHDNPELLEGRG